MITRLLATGAALLAVSTVHAVPVTVGAVTDFYSDTENGWLIFSGSFDPATTDLTTDTVAIEGLSVSGPLNFFIDGLPTFSDLSTTVDLAAGIYTLFVVDSFGDGMTCANAFCDETVNGGFTLSVDGVEIFNNLGAADYGQVLFEFEIFDTPPTVAEPPILALLGLGLIGLWTANRRRNR